MDSPQETTGNPYPATGSATIDAPELNQAETALLLEKKSVKNVAQAWELCKGLEYNNRLRSLRTADMQALYDGKPPGSGTDALEKGKAWQARVSTLWMAGIVGRVAQRMVNAIISQTYATASALPEDYQDAKSKTDFMRKKFTDLFRGWDGNTGFINAVQMETVLQGYAYAAFLDPYGWTPTFFKQEECLVPEKSTEHARDLQFFSAKRDFRIDKFLELFTDEKAAESNGFDIKECLEAANKAVVKWSGDEAQTAQFRKFEDMINEGSLGLSMSATGERIVKTWMLVNREYDGKPSLWLIGRDTGKQLRFSFKLFDRMQDVLAMFSFEAGNGCIHSSKGLGRKLAALATMKELFRCGIIDNSRISGLVIVRVDSKDKTKFAPVIMAPFCMVDKSVEISETQFEARAESYKVVDLLIDSWAQQAVGVYLENQVSPTGRTERTATEASIDKNREDEGSNIVIRRCLDQDANLRQIQQLRVCSDANIKEATRIHEKILKDPEAKAEKLYSDDIDEAAAQRCLVECLEFGITEEELRVWSKSPASLFAHVTEGAIAGGISAAKQVFTGNPNVDQARLDYLNLEGMVGAKFAKELFIPSANQTLQIEAARKQQMESLAMTQSGLAIQVSPRDNHLIEGGVVVALLNNVVSPALSSPNAPDAMIKTAELNLDHLGSHLMLAQQLGQNKSPAWQAMDDFYKKFKDQLTQVVQIRQSVQVAHAAVVQQIRNEGPAGMSVPPIPPSTSAPAPQTSSATPAPGEFDVPAQNQASLQPVT
jgi:acyl-coenzyme A thioesterase PaaI-like protein